MNPGDRTFAGDEPSVAGAENPGLDVLDDVIITGGAGFLGRYLANALATSGRKVTVLDDLSCSNSTFNCAPLQHGGIRCVKGSVFDRGLMNALIAEHKTVVHFASVVGVQETISHPLRTTQNIDGTLNVVNALTPRHIALFASSADV
jgi:nucleoside-diphosphate-sugar epimerase